MAKIEPFENHSELYEKWFDKNKYVYYSELKAIRELLPKEGKGIEIGVGSGRFASPLGMIFGIEPSGKMRRLSGERELIVIDGTAENLPIGSATFNYVLMVTTVCFLDDVMKAFFEVNRILKLHGKFIIGFVDKERPAGSEYALNKEQNPFYKLATFYTTEELLSCMKRAGFSNFEFRQTIFDDLDKIKTDEPILKGFGKGSFVVVKGEKIKGIK
ncbi:hypothetical protein BMS3Abin04_00950 [bacterium BMS3Abin04]|nr:hypothetical protein BMS3Abin04_00950 [bacterium BMS3Abin04]